MKYRISILFIVLLISISHFSNAQRGVDDGSRYGHGDDSVRCVTNLSLYREYTRQNDFISALKYWKPAFNECPASTKNIYIDGVKMYKEFIEKDNNTSVQSGLIDTLMMIYDQRIEYYPADKGDQRGRQGVDLLRYRRNEVKYIQEAYRYLEESVNLGKNKTSEAVIATFFTSAITLYQNELIDETRLIDDFITCNNILEAKLKVTPDNQILKDIKTAQDLNFQNAGVSCEKIIAKLDPLFKNNEKEISNLRLITSALKTSGCTDNPLFFQAAKNYHNLSPSAESAANIAVMAFDKGNYAEAAEYFIQATQIETNPDTKANYYLSLSKTLFKQNKKPEARENAQKALETKPNWGEPYLFIGQLYAESKGDCANISLPNAVYWVAVDKFNRAKSVDSSCEDQANSLIILYSKYYPNKEEAFFQGVHEGDSYKVNCWINETTKARF